MTTTRWKVTEDGAHLPDFANPNHDYGMLGTSLRHHGIEANGLIIATVWNHHDSTECDKVSEQICSDHNAFDSMKDALEVARLTLLAKDGPTAHERDRVVATIKAALRLAKDEHVAR